MALPSDYATRVAAVVKAELTARKISPEALARLTGMSRMTIERRLRHETIAGFSITELAAIAPHIGMTPAEITVAAEQAA